MVVVGMVFSHTRPASCRWSVAPSGTTSHHIFFVFSPYMASGTRGRHHDRFASGQYSSQVDSRDAIATAHPPLHRVAYDTREKHCLVCHAGPLNGDDSHFFFLFCLVFFFLPLSKVGCVLIQV